MSEQDRGETIDKRLKSCYCLSRWNRPTQETPSMAHPSNDPRTVASTLGDIASITERHPDIADRTGTLARRTKLAVVSGAAPEIVEAYRDALNALVATMTETTKTPCVGCGLSDKSQTTMPAYVGDDLTGFMAETTRSRHLRCTRCGKLITRLEWDAFKFSDTYRCCEQMNLQSYTLPRSAECHD